MELRHFSRFAVRCPVTYMSTSARTAIIGKGVVINLSGDGVAIESSVPVQPGVELMCRVYLPDRPRPLLISRATVRWARAGEFGVTTIRMLDEERRRLDTFAIEGLAQCKEDPDGVRALSGIDGCRVLQRDETDRRS